MTLGAIYCAIFFFVLLLIPVIWSLTFTYWVICWLLDCLVRIIVIRLTDSWTTRHLRLVSLSRNIEDSQIKAIPLLNLYLLIEHSQRKVIEARMGHTVLITKYVANISLLEK
jgi:hypothetical protein